jgi:GT2 family glycosyltransferase
MIDLSIIIVAWNSRRDLELCLPSVRGGCAAHTYEVILVDNASTDDSVAYARQVMPEVTVIANGENKGFARANNQGFHAAKGRFLCLLNPDTIVHAGAFDALITFMDGKGDDAWACGPGLLNGDGSEQRTGVRFPSLWNLFVEALFLDRVFPSSRVFGAHRQLYEQGKTPRAVDFVQGSCLVVRGSVVKSVGGLDEEFFMYFEETDWCKRFAENGGRVFMVPGALVTHFGGGTVGHYDERRLVYYHESLLRYFRKHHGTLSGVLVRSIILGRSLIRVCVWALVAAARPSLRESATSAVKGYVRVAGLVSGIWRRR